MRKATDWLGQEYGSGDLVFYSKGYGQSGSQTVLAEVVSVNENTVTARILRGSRSGEYSSYANIDCRTGKRIGYSDIHIKKKAHYKHKVTGEEITSSELYERKQYYTRNESPYKRNASDYQHVPDEYWDYVIKGPYITTFGIKDNITRTPEGFTWPTRKNASQENAPANASTYQDGTTDAAEGSTATTTETGATSNAR